jgi:mono/diheme cytochrome c family protein
MLALRRSVAVAVAGSMLALAGTGTMVWAQGEWKAPAADAAKKSPVKGVSDKTKADVQTNCAPCHGPSGKGDGPAAAALNPKPADWTSDRVQKETDGSLFWKITTGRGAMPPWKSLPENERWEIVNYLHTFKK